MLSVCTSVKLPKPPPHNLRESRPWFVQLTVVPGATVIVAGAKAKSMMVTCAV